jgi:hypothetical protein
MKLCNKIDILDNITWKLCNSDENHEEKIIN